MTVEDQVAALPPGEGAAFERMVRALEAVQTAHDNLLNHHRPEVRLFRSQLGGEIRGLRVAICCLLDRPAEDADKEGPVDDFMINRWESQGWPGWL
jgi:hypothetical protein